MSERKIEQHMGDTLTSRNNARHEASQFNDFGDATGFQDDLSQLERDLKDQLWSIEQRYEILRRRMRQHNRDLENKKNQFPPNPPPSPAQETWDYEKQSPTLNSLLRFLPQAQTGSHGKSRQARDLRMRMRDL